MKRIMDFALALTGLFILSPVLFFVAVLIKCTSRGPVFFRQERVGRDFKLFTFYKFRSMYYDADKKGPGVTSQCDPRITSAGRWLRRTKLDELPQLVNVLLGDISLVGPRPELEKYIVKHRKDYQDILKVRPGITDYAAIDYIEEERVLSKFEDKEKGYLEEVLPEKIALYKKYIDEAGFWTDMKILFRTVLKMVKR
ncbi:MAG: sugar transferase [bacterium]|nr:sugar transferase [bacterium]